ncbi:MAG: fibronectin type III domain-containing protein [Pseudomonadota bacterium]
MKQGIGCTKVMMAAVVIAAITATTAFAKENALAIFNLRPTNMDAMAYSGDILFSVISALEKDKRLELMPRRKMEEILFQEGLVQSDIPEQVIHAGKALAIQYILYGQVTKTGPVIKADLHLMDIRQQKIARSWAESFSGREAIAARMGGFASELASAVGGGAAVSQVSVAEAAGPMAGISLTAVKARSEGNQIIVAWSHDDNLTPSGFHVYRSSSPQGPYQFLGGTTDLRFVDENVRKGMTYYYQVGILEDAGGERKSEITAKIAFTGERMPHPPLIMSSSGHVRRASIQLVPSLLNDQEGFTITGYKVYRRSDGDTDWQVAVTVDIKRQSQSELSMTVEDAGPLADGRVYQFAVSSVEKKGQESDLSDAVAITVLAKPVLELEKDGLLRQIQIRWQPVEKVSGYHIYRSLDGLSWERITSNNGQDKARHTDKNGLEDGRDYRYQVTAFDDKGESSPSNVILARTKDLPQPPAGVAGKSGMVKSVALSWQPIADPDVGGYNIYRGTQPQRLERIDTVRGNTKSTYMDKGSGFKSLADGTDYYYSVESYNQYKALGGISPPILATTKPRPLAVAGLSANAAATEIVVSWQPNPEKDIAAYVVYRSKDQGSWSKYSTIPGDQTRMADADLKPETQYRYRVVAVDADGLESDPSDSGSVASPLVVPVKS